MPIRIPGQTQRQVLPTGRSGQVFAPRGLGQTAGPLGSIAGSFRQLGRTFNEVDLRLISAEMSAEQAQGQAFVNDQFLGQQQFEATNNDENFGITDGKQDTLYQREWDKRLKLIQDNSQGFKYKGSQQAYNNWITKQSPVWQAQLSTRINIQRIDKARADLNSLGQTIATTDNITNMGSDLDGDAEAIPDVPLTPEEDRDARELLLRRAARKAVDDEIISEQQAQKFVADHTALIGAAQDNRLFLGVRSIALNLPTEQEAIQFINDFTGQLSREDRNDLKEQVRSEFKFEEDKLNKAQSANSTGIFRTIFDGKTSRTDIENQISQALVPDAKGNTAITQAQASSLRTILRQPIVSINDINAFATMTRAISQLRRGRVDETVVLEELGRQAAKLTPTANNAFITDIFQEADALRSEISDSADRRGRNIISRRVNALAIVGDPKRVDEIRSRISDQFSSVLAQKLRDEEIKTSDIDKMADELATSMEVSQEAAEAIGTEQEREIRRKEAVRRKDLEDEARKARDAGDKKKMAEILSQMIDEGLLSRGELGAGATKKKSGIGRIIKNILSP